MTEILQTGWTRLRTRTGIYEYQFQGSVPAVRAGKYEEATDYQFLVMDEDGWLYKIPVRLETTAEKLIRRVTHTEAAPADKSDAARQVLRIVEAQLRRGLEDYRPRPNESYAELDARFRVTERRAGELSSSEG